MVLILQKTPTSRLLVRMTRRGRPSSTNSNKWSNCWVRSRWIERSIGKRSSGWPRTKRWGRRRSGESSSRQRRGLSNESIDRVKRMRSDRSERKRNGKWEMKWGKKDEKSKKNRGESDRLTPQIETPNVSITKYSPINFRYSSRICNATKTNNFFVSFENSA